MRKIAGKNCEKIAVPEPNLPKRQRAILHRWLRMFLCLFKTKKLRKTCDKMRKVAKNCDKLRKLRQIAKIATNCAIRNPPPPVENVGETGK